MNEETLFHLALERPAGERATFLEQACGGDAALRQRLETLLQAHDNPGSFLGRPAVQPTVEGPAGQAGRGDTQLQGPGGDGDANALDFLAPTRRPGSLGRLGHYEVLDVLGRGGMGVVLKAFDEKLHRVVAIKVLAPQLAVSATGRKRFVREARAAAAVRDEHVVDIHAVEDADGLPYLVMEYISGASLQERLDRRGPLPLQDLLRIGMQAAAGLAAAHAQGLIHRDVKPANILLEDGAERVKLTDFGLARAVDDATLTQSGVIAGTPRYMSPEQAEGRAVDHRSDLFSLGSVLYAMCTGQPPFGADSTMAVLKRVCEDTPRPIRESNPEVPPWLVETIARLHAKDPAERFQSAAELAALFGQRLAESRQTARPSPPRATAGATRPPGRRWLPAAAVLLLLTGGLGLTEATGVTRLGPTVIRIMTGEGALVVEVDDPAVEVTVEGDGGLRITGAGPQEVRLRPGQYRWRASKDGKAVGGDLVTVTRGGRQVVKVSREGPVDAAAPPAATAETSPFVIAARDGRPETKFDTLAGAVRSAWDGDTIEVRGNGPFAGEPILIKGHAVRIRAGEGFRPVFRVSPPAERSLAEVVRSSSPLVLEGLEFQVIGPEETTPGFCRTVVVGTDKAPLYVANCRFIRNYHGNTLGAISSPACEIRNCQFIAEGGVIAGYRSSSRTVLENNLIVAAHPLGLQCTAAADGSVQLTRNTLVGTWLITFDPFPDAGAPRKDINDGRKPLRIRASGNVFDGGHSVLFFRLGKPAEEPAELLRQFAAWDGNHNLFSSDACAASLIKDRPALISARLADWDHFWGGTDTASVESRRLHYLGGDVRARANRTPDHLTPADLRLHPDSPGHGAGKGGEDLGADTDLVGPGPAYERWKKTPGYQEWLKTTGQTRP